MGNFIVAKCNALGSLGWDAEHIAMVYDCHEHLLLKVLYCSGIYRKPQILDMAQTRLIKSCRVERLRVQGAQITIACRRLY